MKKTNLPRSPFSTPLSRAAKETELRLRNLFQWKKQRPPLPYLALMAAAVLMCGGLVSCQAEAETSLPETELWLDYLTLDNFPWDGSQEIQLPEYPDITFRWTPGEVAALEREGEFSLISGMPVMNVFLCDLTGDGNREFCATVAMGSGIVDYHVVAYDYAAKTEYILEARGEYDYTLSLEDGQLRVSRRVYQGGPPLQNAPVSTGLLSISPEGVLEMKDERPAEPPAPPEGYAPVELDAGLLQLAAGETTLEHPYEFLTQEESALLQNLPAAELPREAVEISHASRQDYWRDVLLPVACDEGADVTVYFVAGGMPDVEPLVNPAMWDLRPDGIVLRHGGRTAYFPLYWGGNAHFVSNPLLLADDLDGDGQPEAALVLTTGWGTGCFVSNLYIFDLDDMTYTTPDCSSVPMDITCNGEQTSARIESGGQELEVDLTQLGIPFPGAVELGSQVAFQLVDGKLVCHLELDFACNTGGYLAGADFPIVYEDGGYKLGPATALYNNLNW